MPIITDGPALEPANKGIDEYHVNWTESLGATASEAIADFPTVQLKNLLTMPGQEVGPRGGETDVLGNALPSNGPSIAEATRPAMPRIDIMDANDRVKKAGLAPHLKLPDQPDIPPAQLEIMMSRAQARREYEVTQERGPHGFVQSSLSVGTSFLVGAVDPLNIASAFVPIMGELRYAKLLASAGEGAAFRAGIRAAVGAGEGAFGQALLEPLDWWSHTQDGRDFGMSDVLHNIMFGAVLGGALHTGGGAISDAWRARHERPMYPYDLGEPLESHTPWNELRTRSQPPAIPRDVLGEFRGIRDVPIFNETPDHPVTMASLVREAEAARPTVPSAAVQTINDLPPRAREDLTRAGLASLIEGEPLRVGEMAEAAALTDPRIAESFDAHIRNERLSAPAAREAVFDDVHRKLIDAGMGEDEAGYNAAVVAARYAARAERLGNGMNAVDLYRAEGLDVRAGEHGPAEGRSFQQPRGEGADLFAAREADGQLGLPGTERIGQGELAQRKADEALKPKVAQKPLDVGLFGDSAAQKSFFQSRPLTPAFYSAVDRAIGAAKQDRASPEQWLGMLKNAAGVKPEEMKWLGLEDWLKEQKGSVTKEQVRDFVRANQIEVKEVTKGDRTGQHPAFTELQDLNRRLIDQHGYLSTAYEKMSDAELEHYDEVSTRAVDIRAAKADELYGKEYNALREFEQKHVDDELNGTATDTKYPSYVLPGGENYRELLLALPKRSTEIELPGKWGSASLPENNYQSAHWDEPNILAHIRFDDRVSDGRKTLHVAEVQSDWHQAGKRRGYEGEGRGVAEIDRDLDANTAELIRRAGPFDEMSASAWQRAWDSFTDLRDRRQELYAERGGRQDAVPNAPFKTTWPELSMKRIIRYAAEHGYDRISWDTGATNAERYNLSKQVSRLYFQKNKDGTYKLNAETTSGHPAPIGDAIPEAKLADHVGKDVADRIVKKIEQFKVADDLEPVGSLEGLDLKVGGEGMAGFYDKILPATVNRLVKKFGSKVEDTSVQAQGEGRKFGFTEVHAVDITPELRKAAVEHGFPLFQGGEDSPRGRITLSDNRAVIDLFKAADRSTFMHESGHLWLEELMRDAAHQDAPAPLRADRDTVLAWLGVKDAGEIGTAQHEKWAEGFEHYLGTGEAPSNALAKAFEQFKAWLADIYRAIAGLHHEISPEIRGVMDRMLATDREIAERNAGRQPLGDATAAARPAPVKPKRGRAAADPATWSLFEYLASRGGLKPDADLLATFGSNKSPFVPGFGPLLRKTGMSMDDALVAAKEGGYFLDPTSQEHVQMRHADLAALNQAPTFTLRDLHEKIDEESRGRKQYRDGHVQEARADAGEEAHYIIRALYDELEASSGQKGIALDPAIERRVVEIIQKEGEHDVLAAHERAIMEDEERYNAVSEARHADPRDATLPGWDVPDDAGPASARGGEAARAGGEAGRAGPGAGGDAGVEPRIPGPGDRAPQKTKLDQDAAWRRLAHATPEFNDPNVIAASNAAAEVKRPPTKLDERLTAAEKAEAYAKQMYDMFAERIPPEDRQRLDDLIKTIESDHEAREIAIERGGACLYGARE